MPISLRQLKDLALGAGQGIGNLGAGILDKLEPFSRVLGTKEIFVENPPEQTPDVDLAHKIGSYETAGVKDPYGFRHPKTSDLGRYQVSPPTLKSDAKIYLGRDVTEKEFLKNPHLQDTFTTKRIKRWKEEFGMSDDEIVKRWNVGLRGDINSPVAKEYHRRVMIGNRRGGMSDEMVDMIYKALDKYIVNPKNYGEGELKNRTIADYSFTPKAVKIIGENAKVNNKSANYKGGKPPYEAENLEGEADGKDKINILKADSNAVVHEFFHTLAQHDEGFNGFYKEFQEDFNELKEDLEPLKIIDIVLMEDKKNYPDDTSQKELTEERWAYVGETFAGGGLEAFPEQLRKYYEPFIN